MKILLKRRDTDLIISYNFMFKNALPKFPMDGRCDDGSDK